MPRIEQSGRQEVFGTQFQDSNECSAVHALTEGGRMPFAER